FVAVTIEDGHLHLRSQLWGHGGHGKESYIQASPSSSCFYVLSFSVVLLSPILSLPASIQEEISTSLSFFDFRPLSWLKSEVYEVLLHVHRTLLTAKTEALNQAMSQD
ncbi:hypothetical protein CARUB_v10024376mg, partial [Capsella rubella]